MSDMLGIVIAGTLLTVAAISLGALIGYIHGYEAGRQRAQRGILS